MKPPNKRIGPFSPSSIARRPTKKCWQKKRMLEIKDHKIVWPNSRNWYQRILQHHSYLSRGTAQTDNTANRPSGQNYWEFVSSNLLLFFDHMQQLCCFGLRIFLLAAHLLRIWTSSRKRIVHLKKEKKLTEVENQNVSKQTKKLFCTISRCASKILLVFFSLWSF